MNEAGIREQEDKEYELTPKGEIIHLVFEFTRIFISSEEADHILSLTKEAQKSPILSKTGEQLLPVMLTRKEIIKLLPILELANKPIS